MSKILKSCIIFLFLISLVGCENNVTDLNGTNKTEFNIDEIVVYKNINYSIVKAEYTDGLEYGFGPNEDENNIYYVLTFQIENNSKKAYEDSYGCILNTKETTSEKITTIVVSDENNIEPLGAGEKETTVLAWEISKEDHAQTYNCHTSEVEFTFDLTK
jgi:hypothetical protein